MEESGQASEGKKVGETKFYRYIYFFHYIAYEYSQNYSLAPNFTMLTPSRGHCTEGVRSVRKPAKYLFILSRKLL